ncbi:F-box domain-containing protein, partial [Colletotrichum plurivorum]
TSSPAGVILTGVGIRDNSGHSVFIAPTNPRRRWDDPSYDRPQEDEYGAMRQLEVNGRYGFVFHEACWDILQKASDPRPVSVTRLFDICRSLPFPQLFSGLSWGHDHGGLVDIDDEHHFPWEEDRFTDSMYLEPDPVRGENPYEVPKVRVVLLAEAPGRPPSPGPTISVDTMPEEHGFMTLPLELRCAIAVYLPTSDVLNLRLASRAFWAILDNQGFWASRFGDVSERSWLFEIWDDASAKARDWRWLYRRTNHGSMCPGLQNRTRVWSLAQKMLEIVEFSWAEVGVTASPKPEPHRWTHVSGNLWEPPTDGSYPLFWGGCRLFRKHHVPIPDDLLRLSVSSVRVGDAEYLAGLKLITVAGESHQVGYWSATAIERSSQVSEIRGFKLAVGFRGIQGLQCTVRGSNTDDHPWLGSTERSPKTLRLDVDKRVTELEVGFDPDVPGPSLCLNEDSFPPRDHYLGGYNPLLWTSFGGPGGAYLRHFTGLSVVWGRGVHRIDFAHDVAVPFEQRTLGCLESKPWTKNNDFAVDGPGGEIIEAVELFRCNAEEVRLRCMVEEGDLAAFRGEIMPFLKTFRAAE